LQHVVDKHPDAAIKETATNIQVLIATHGHVSLSSCDAAPSDPLKHTSVKSCVKEAEDAAKLKPKPLIEVISSNDGPATEQSSSQTTRSDFQTAMKELADVLVPVRGHALLTLRRLVDSGDSEALNSVDKLLSVCDQTVDDTDSYIYLYTIQLLASLAARFPQQTLPWLAGKYLGTSQLSQAGGVSHQQSVAERRMKLGEVLVKTSSALGNK